MMVRQALVALALTVLVVAGCSNEVTFEKQPLDEKQTRNELQGLGITLPENYTLVSMTKMPPPGSGGAGYDGVFRSPSPAAPVQVDATPVPMAPTTCQELRWYDLPDGLDCAMTKELRRGEVSLTSADSLSVAAAQLPSGESHIYLSVSGH